MMILGTRALALCRCLPPLLLVLAYPVAADIKVDILRAQIKAAAPAPATDLGAAATAAQPPAAAEESPDNWYRRASALEHADADADDLALAAYWYRQAAEKGHTDAQTKLAAMYADGRGVEVDGLEATRWYMRAADAGNARAQYDLALMYHLGKGVRQDYDDAIRWYQSAARQGDANAMNNIAFMYGMGEGVVQSDVEAYAWFALAADRGNADAAENRDLAASEMTPEQRRNSRERYTQLEKQLGL